MARPFAATLTASGQSLAAWGIAVDDVAGWFSGAPRTLVRARVPGRAGSVVARADEGEKVLQVSATLVSDTVANRNNRLDQIQALLAGQPIQLERVDAATRTTGRGHIEGAIDVIPVKPGMRRPAAVLRFRVVLDSAYVQDTAPLPYGFGTTRTAMPLGTAPVAPLVRLFGSATNPILRYRDAAGTIQNACTFTITLGANDWLEIDCATWRVEKVVAGTRSDAYSTYSGDNLPVLDPDDGRWVDSAWPTLETSAGTGIAIYARRWR